MSTIFEVLHVVAAVFIIGPMAILPMTALRALRSDSASDLAVLTKSTYVFSLLSLVVAFLGFGLVGMSSAEDNFTFSTPWIDTSIVLYVVAILVSLFQVVPAMRRATTQLATTSPSPGATAARSSKDYTAIAAGSGVVSLLLVVTAVLMVWKP